MKDGIQARGRLWVKEGKGFGPMGKLQTLPETEAFEDSVAGAGFADWLRFWDAAHQGKAGVNPARVKHRLGSFLTALQPLMF